MIDVPALIAPAILSFFANRPSELRLFAEGTDGCVILTLLAAGKHPKQMILRFLDFGVDVGGVMPHK